MLVLHSLRWQVNISGGCREAILSTDVTAHDIFDRARAEVLALMEVSPESDDGGYASDPIA